MAGKRATLAIGNKRAWRRRHVAAALAACVVLAVPALQAQETDNVKELLDRAQKNPQKQAVEDLIRKLKGGDPAPEKAPAAKADPPSVSAPPPAVVEKPPAADPPKIEAAMPPAPAVPPAVVVAPPPVGPPAEPTPAPLRAVTAAPPAAPKPEVAEALPTVDLEVHFDYNSSRVTLKAVNVLATLGAALADQRLAGQLFLIAGHTDARGGDTFNLNLSRARAEAVRAFLIQHFSLSADRLQVEGHGYRRLKNPRAPFAAENRRVQITNITSQSAGR
jgi:outer membrane protein OmpA-like peptidoglycan-associated protein